MKDISALLNILNKYKTILNNSQKKWGIVVTLMTVIGALLETLGVSVILPLVQAMLEPEVVSQNMIVKKVSSFLGVDSNIELLMLVAGGVIVIYVLKNAFLFLLSFVRIKYSCKVQRELSVEMMESYMRRGYAFFTNTTTGELLRGMQGSIYNTYNGLYQLLRLLAEALTTVCICIYVLISDWVMAIIVLFVVVFCLMTVVMGFKRWAQRSGEIIYKYDALLNKTILQAFQGIKEVLVMNKQRFFVGVYEKDYIKRQKGVVWQTVAAESPAYLIETSCVIGMLVALGINLSINQDGIAMIPQLATLAMAAVRIMPSLGRITSSINTFITCVPGIEETYTNISYSRMYFEQKNVENIDKDLVKIKDWNTFELRNISWNYPDSNQQILNNISLKIEKGKSIALIGASGAGKTTLGDIILGLHIPQTGAIYIDDEDITHSPYDISRIIGFVPQNAYLLDDTIRRNVAFGIPNDRINDEMVWKALEQSQMKEFILNMAGGLDAVIGESGVRLSGGQRQRIAVARALYTNPSIIVLDEATSALDSDTEVALMDAVETLHGEKTLIIIAHRLSTIQNCDEIYRIQDGKLNKVLFQELI